MAEVNVQKSSFFKEKKEEPNTDFSLVKGALTENINRLEKLMNSGTSKYMRDKKRERKCIVHFLSLFICNLNV
ncbi:stage III sporulation protein AA [Bacillus paranthracis]|uniref:stage III sporulation protein AA n=1 Tax=Bacillus paranthracis TaxID=2026186 RepID=UPI001C956268|nr:stage III sporulation protein AA [Bacillus paranthracis]MBY5232417.1 stage III sporulation protein AA [Bacillus paranthracis]